MAEIVKKKFITQQLIQINTYRFFLQVFHLSDISHPNSNSILEKILTESEHNYPTSTHR